MSDRCSLKYWIYPSPGGLIGDDLVGLFELLLADEAFISGPPSVNGDSDPVSLDSPAIDLSGRLEKRLLTAYGYSEGLTVNGRGDTHLVVEQAVDASRSGLVRGFAATSDFDLLLDSVVAVASYLEAPAGVVCLFGPDWDFLRRRGPYGKVLKALQYEVPIGRLANYCVGVLGVGYRSFVGQPFVDLYGVEALERLAGEGLAWQKGQYWVLAGSESVTSWTADVWCDQERHIIETLGTQFFYNPETGELPKVWPDLPAPVSRTVLLKDPETKEMFLQHPDGSTSAAEKVDPDVLAVDRFALVGQAITSEMVEVVPEFETDDQVFWIEERIAVTAVERREQVIEQYGAWFGEFLRAHAGGEWMKSAAGSWMIRVADSGDVDPFNAVAGFLDDRSQRLKHAVDRLKSV